MITFWLKNQKSSLFLYKSCFITISLNNCQDLQIYFRNIQSFKIRRNFCCYIICFVYLSLLLHFFSSSSSSWDQDALCIISLMLYEVDIRDIYIDFLVFIQGNGKKKIVVRGVSGGGVNFVFSLLLEIGLSNIKINFSVLFKEIQ